MALEAIQCLGGDGYTNEYPTGRLLRDAKLYEIGAGTSENPPLADRPRAVRQTRLNPCADRGGRHGGCRPPIHPCRSAVTISSRIWRFQGKTGLNRWPAIALNGRRKSLE